MDIQRNLTEAFYVTVGAGVITFQRAQELSRDLAAVVARRVDDELVVAIEPTKAADLVEARTKAARERLEQLADAVEERVEPVVHQVTALLPSEARHAVAAVRTRVDDARRQVRRAA